MRESLSYIHAVRKPANRRIMAVPKLPLESQCFNPLPLNPIAKFCSR